MSNKLKRNVNKKSNVKNKSSTKSVKKQKSLVQSNPKLSTIVLITMYFTLDYLMMETTTLLSIPMIIICTLLASSVLYSYYVNDYHRGIYPVGGTDMPKFVKNKKKYATIGWAAITAWGVIFLIIEPIVVPRFFPVINDTYYQSQVMLILFIAPVVEEIIFRYLLYDRLLRRKWGWFWGFVAASLIFALCHPVTNVHSLIIYWAPTLLFFLIYHEFGLYGAIVIHMIYNMMAI